MFDSVISAKAVQLQRDAAEVATMYGDGGAAAPMSNEGDESYQRRLLAGMQPRSPTFRYSNFDSQSAAYLDDTFQMVRADAIANFKKPEGQLRPAVRLDSTGRRITEWFGDPHETWQMFSMPPRYVRFRTELAQGGYAPADKRAHSD